MKSKRLPATVVAALVLMSASANSAITLWVHDGDDLGRIDMTSPTSGTFTYVGKFGTGATGPAGTTWGDTFGATRNAMTDIAFNGDGTVLYGLSCAQGATNNANSYLWMISTVTGVATLVTTSGNNIPGDGTLPAGSDGVDSFTLTNALGLGSNGQMLTAISTDKTIYSIDLSNNSSTILGNFVTSNSTVKYSGGDIVTHEGSTYLTASAQKNLGGNNVTNYLVEMNLSDLAASTLVGAFSYSSGTDLYDNMHGLVSTPFGLYAFDADSKAMALVDTTTAGLTPVTLTGSTAALSGFFGAASVPEPSRAMLMLAGLAGMTLRRRRSPRRRLFPATAETFRDGPSHDRAGKEAEHDRRDGRSDAGIHARLAPLQGLQRAPHHLLGRQADQFLPAAVRVHAIGAARTFAKVCRRGAGADGGDDDIIVCQLDTERFGETRDK